MLYQAIFSLQHSNSPHLLYTWWRLKMPIERYNKSHIDRSTHTKGAAEMHTYPIKSSAEHTITNPVVYFSAFFTCCKKTTKACLSNVYLWRHTSVRTTWFMWPGQRFSDAVSFQICSTKVVLAVWLCSKSCLALYWLHKQLSRQHLNWNETT